MLAIFLWVLGGLRLFRFCVVTVEVVFLAISFVETGRHFFNYLLSNGKVSKQRLDTKRIALTI